jgi:putative ABC transport system permease protein
MIYLNFFIDSVRQAFHELKTSKLRSFLSLLGITIGIFSIISVKSAVDSLEDNIKSSFAKLGTDIIYIDRFPWNEDPGQNYWKYIRRPEISYEDYEAIMEKSKLAQKAAFVGFLNGKTIKYKSSSVEGMFFMAPTYDYAEMMDMDFELGRHFTRLEYETGQDKAILGHNISNELFGDTNPVGQYIHFYGRKFMVVGVIAKEGQGTFRVMPFDDVAVLPFNSARKFIDFSEPNMTGKMLAVQSLPGTDIEELRGELTGILRAHRRIKPLDTENFSVNDVGMFNQILESIFQVIGIAGFFIGVFALVVGMISIANIMFVSVKERTNIIGIKKAIGAKRWIILLEFLLEAIVLCLIGGVAGLLLVFGLTKGISASGSFIMTLSVGNIFWGVFWSVFVGILAGLLPALQASKLDPVEAIRQ